MQPNTSFTHLVETWAPESARRCTVEWPSALV